MGVHNAIAARPRKGIHVTIQKASIVETPPRPGHERAPANDDLLHNHRLFVPAFFLRAASTPPPQKAHERPLTKKDVAFQTPPIPIVAARGTVGKMARDSLHP